MTFTPFNQYENKPAIGQGEEINDRSAHPHRADGGLDLIRARVDRTGDEPEGAFRCADDRLAGIAARVINELIERDAGIGTDGEGGLVLEDQLRAGIPRCIDALVLEHAEAGFQCARLRAQGPRRLVPDGGRGADPIGCDRLLAPEGDDRNARKQEPFVGSHWHVSDYG